MSAVTSATVSTSGEEKSMLNDFIVSLSSRLVHAQADIAHTMCWLPAAIALGGNDDVSVTQALHSYRLIENTAVQEPLKEAVVREDIDQALADMEDIDSALEDFAQTEEHAVSLDAKEASATADETVPVVSRLPLACNYPWSVVAGRCRGQCPDVDPKTAIVAKKAGETADTVLVSANELSKGLETKAMTKAKKGLGAKAKNWFLGCSQASTAEPKAAKQKASKAPKAKSAAPAA